MTDNSLEHLVTGGGTHALYMAVIISGKQLHNIHPARAEWDRQKGELVFLNAERGMWIGTSALFHAQKAQLIPWKDDGSLFVEHTNGRELFLKLETTPLHPQVLKIFIGHTVPCLCLTAEEIYIAQRLLSHGSG